MSFVLRSRANNEADERQQRDWINQAFTRYPVPIDLGQDIIDPISGNTMRIQYRYLGNASVKSGTQFSSNAMFYEIAESELSENSKKNHQNGSNSSTCSSDEVVTMASTSEITPPPPAAVILDSEKSPMALPPKKRKRRRVLRYEVIFCLKTAKDFRHTILDSRQYYLFPREAIVESLNDTPPLEASVSFHLPKGTNNSVLCSCHEEKQRPSYTSKLEEFAAVCTNNDLPIRQRRRFTDPGLQFPSHSQSYPLTNRSKTDYHVLNIRLSGISKALYVALKETVSDFENVYGKMIELMKLHSQQISTQKLDLVIDNVDEEDLKFTNMITQGHASERFDWSSDEEDDDDDYIETEQDDDTLSNQYMKTATPNNMPNTKPNNIISPPLPAVKPRSNSTSTTVNGSSKKCLYCGSKSTPMWRRGPQGAGTLCNACGVKWKHGKILCGSDAPPVLPHIASDQIKVEKKKRKYGNTSKKEKRSKAVTKKRLSVNSSTTEDMDYLPYSSMTHDMETATRSLNLNESSPIQHHTGDYFVSPSTSFTSTSTSPPLLPPIINHQRRHTTDMSLIEKFGLMNNSYALATAGVDAVEAAAVLTLLKRS